jgi:putative glutamine amidotransferase
MKQSRALRVGITADWEETRGRRRQVLNADYSEWALDGGLVPVALPSIPGSEDAALEGLAALILSGGGDIPPSLYGADPEPLPEEKFSHPQRAAFEFALLWRSLRLGMPILGICLGCQTINAALGGDLVRHLEDPSWFHRGRFPGAAARHRIRTEPNTLVESLYPSPDTRVVSSHHQAIGRLAPGWRVTAWGPGDVPEAIEHPAHPTVLGVQWHPERSPRSLFSRNLIEWLRGAAEGYAHRSGRG